MSLIVQDFQRRDQRVAPQDTEALLTSGVASAQSLSARELALTPSDIRNPWHPAGWSRLQARVRRLVRPGEVIHSYVEKTKVAVAFGAGQLLTERLAAPYRTADVGSRRPLL
jgi:hypothetical protein